MDDKPFSKDRSTFWDIYDKHYKRLGNQQPSQEKYDNRTARSQYKADWFPQNHETAILDIGFGWGNLLSALWTAGYHNLYGVDISQPMYEVATRNLPIEIKLECADAIDYLQEYTDSFDLIIIFDVIEHMPVEEALRLLKVCKNALRASGSVVIRTPNLANLLAPYILHSDVTHVKGYSEWSLYQLLDLAGFSNHRVIVENRSGLANWALHACLRHPLAGLNIERILSIILHRMLYTIHPQIPRPTVFDFNIVVQSNK